MKYTVKKGLTGYVVRYACPGCQIVLRAPLKDADNNEVCTDCGTKYVVPGGTEKKKVMDAIAAKKKQIADQKEQAKAEKELQQRLAAEEKERQAEAQAAENRQMQLVQEQQRAQVAPASVPTAPHVLPPQPQHTTPPQFPGAATATFQTHHGPTSVNTQVVVASETPNTYGTAGFITSLASLVTCGFIAPLGVILSLIGLKHPNKGFAIGGLVIGLLACIPAVFILINFILVGAAVSSAGTAVAEASERMEQEAAEAEQQLKLVKITDVSVTRGQFGRNSVTFTVTNGLPVAISSVRFGITATRPGRQIPDCKEAISFEIGGGVEPGETQSFTVEPNIFSDLRDAAIPPESVITTKMISVDGADGEPLYDAWRTVGGEFSDF